jgi:hypothetical protein
MQELEYDDIDNNKQLSQSLIQKWLRSYIWITVITAYRVHQQKVGVGSTIFHQQQLDFDEEGKIHINLCKRFFSEDMHALVKIWFCKPYIHQEETSVTGIMSTLSVYFVKLYTGTCY